MLDSMAAHLFSHGQSAVHMTHWPKREFSLARLPMEGCLPWSNLPHVRWSRVVSFLEWQGNAKYSRNSLKNHQVLKCTADTDMDSERDDIDICRDEMIDYCQCCHLWYQKTTAITDTNTRFQTLTSDSRISYLLSLAKKKGSAQNYHLSVNSPQQYPKKGTYLKIKDYNYFPLYNTCILILAELTKTLEVFCQIAWHPSNLFFSCSLSKLIQESLFLAKQTLQFPSQWGKASHPGFLIIGAPTPQQKGSIRRKTFSLTHSIPERYIDNIKCRWWYWKRCLNIREL